MHWKTKAHIQRIISLLPSRLSYAVYYEMQKRFGALRQATPLLTLRAGVSIGELARQSDVNLQGARVLEVGTGRRVNLPIALWLAGADEIVTVDLHPYLRPELIALDIIYIQQNAAAVRELFTTVGLERDRFEALLDVDCAHFDVDDFLKMCGIRYEAPADATHLEAADGSFDLHVSYTVFEHIPATVLRAILAEGNRIVRPGGLFCHRIDFTDHFSHSDLSLPTINFLQFDDAEWERLAGNRYMYMNRLRVDDYQDIFEACGQEIVRADVQINDEALQLVQSNAFPLADRFRDKSPEQLAAAAAWFVTRTHQSESGILPFNQVAQQHYSQQHRRAA